MMFRKTTLCHFQCTMPRLLLAQPTTTLRLGRRKGLNLDDGDFMGRSNLPSYSAESGDDFASFVATRQEFLANAPRVKQREGRPLSPLPSSMNASASKIDGMEHASISPLSKGKGKRISINAGGQVFETFEGTLLQYPQTAFGQMILEQIANAMIEKGETPTSNTTTKHELFLDVDPKIFNFILQFLRSGKLVLPTDDEPLRFAINNTLSDFGLLDVAFPPIRTNVDGEPVDPEEAIPMVRLPDVCVVQMCDHLQHDQGVKRHALNISYGSDGFGLKDLCKKVRKDLNGQLSNTYWQCYQTHERSMFLITTKIANGTADLMMASVTQRIIEHTEQTMGYRLVSSYVTLSPDIKNTNVRLFIHNLIFRRVRNPSLEDTDAIQLFSNADGSISAAMGVVSGLQHQSNMKNREDPTFVPNEEMFKNFEPPAVGPQGSYGQLGMPLAAPPGQSITGNIWQE